VNTEASVSCSPLQESFWETPGKKENKQHFSFVFFHLHAKKGIS
jgi:hypothetical protein